MPSGERPFRDHRERDARRLGARTIETITDLNTLGICFSMDDFGIGFSSLSSLKQLPLASFKIDRSFISQVLTSERDTSNRALND